MKQKDKELLFVDLCARLPYGVKCFHPYGIGELDSIGVEDYGIDVTFKTPDDNYCPIEECKPYLRQMSSMTEGEEAKYQDLNNYELGIFPSSVDAFDYLIEHHFDYRGLIEKGLAIEVTEENNPYKE